MFEWSDLRYFLAVYRTGSSSAAARRLGVSQTTVGRRIEALEEALGTRLFHKTPQGYVASEQAPAIVEMAEAMEAAALALARNVEGDDQRLDGILRIASTAPFASGHLVELVTQLHAAHPDLEFELLTDYRASSLTRREADVAVRLFRPVESSLVARKVGEIPLELYASRAYLDEHGLPESDEGWRAHAFVGYSGSLAEVLEARWWKTHAPLARPVVRVSDLGLVREVAAAGLGVALLPRFMGDASERLQRLEICQDLPVREVWVTFHRDLRENARVRVFVEALTRALSRATSGPTGASQ